jgi:hypothetical protein
MTEQPRRARHLMVGVAAGFAIHQRSVLTPWLLVGLVPGIVGLWLTVVR